MQQQTYYLNLKLLKKKDDKLTNNKKGKVILVSSTAKSNFILSPIKPGAIKYTKNGVKISAKVTIKISNSKSKFKTLSAKIFPFFFVF